MRFPILVISIISSPIPSSIIGIILGALVGAKIGQDIIHSAIIGSIVGANFSFTWCVIDHIWHPLRSKCSVCGSTNLEPWDYKRDHCLDCGMGTNYYGSNFSNHEPTSNSEPSH